MRYKLPGGQIVGQWQAFTHDEIQYPENWIALATPAERNALGLVEVPDPVRADDRFYWNGDISTPKDLDQLKAVMVGQVKATARSLLSETDWKIQRSYDPSSMKPVDAATLAEREAIRAASDENEAAIHACSTVSALAILQLSWPAKEVL